MKTEQAEPENFFGYKQVADVGLGKPLAGAAVALLIQRGTVLFKLGVLDVAASSIRKKCSGAPHARRCDAIEEIDSPRNTFHQSLRGNPRP